MPSSAFSIHPPSVSASFKQGITMVRSIASAIPKNLLKGRWFGECCHWRISEGVPAINDMSRLVSPFPGGAEHHERLESELGSAQRESANVDLCDIGYCISVFLQRCHFSSKRKSKPRSTQSSSMVTLSLFVLDRARSEFARFRSSNFARKPASCNLRFEFAISAKPPLIYMLQSVRSNRRSFRFLCDQDDSRHVFGETFRGHELQLPNFAESNQFQKRCQHASAQSPKVGRVVVLHVHEVADIRVFRVIEYLGFQSKITAGPQVIEGGPEREHRIRKVIKRAEVKDDIKPFWAAECLRARNKEFCVYASKLREETRDFDSLRHDVDASATSAVFLCRVDTVVTGPATDIEQSPVREISERNGGLYQAELVQWLFGKWKVAFEVFCRNTVIKIDPMTPWLPQ